MSLKITLPDRLEKRLREEAKKQQLAPDALALRILDDALWLEEAFDVEDVVARIKALPANPNSIRPATQSLQELLQNAPDLLEMGRGE